MTIAVDLGRKATKQTNKINNYILLWISSAKHYGSSIGNFSVVFGISQNAKFYRYFFDQLSIT